MLFHRAAYSIPFLTVLPAFANERYVVADNGATSQGTDDKLWTVQDLNGDDDFNDPGEVVAFYDENLGGITIATTNGVAVATDGTVFACDSTVDIVLRVRDSNGDGDGNDPFESNVFYHSLTNAMGLNLSSPLNLVVDSNGVVWVANSGTAGVDDSIFRLEDLNGDGDADDANESRLYFVPAPGGATGDSIPSGITIGHDGALYYVDNGPSGVIAKGIYRLEDLDASGFIDAPGEVTPYFMPPAGIPAGFHWCVQVDAQGYYYMNDTGNERLWRGKDLDASGSIDPATEAVVWYTVGSASNLWQVAFADNGDVICAEDEAPDRLLRLSDSNGSGVIEPSEVTAAYSDLVSATNIVSPRSIARFPSGFVGGPFCAGDGIDPGVTTPCPCANVGTAGRGCANSANASGALLEASGSTTLDDVVLEGSGMPAAVSCIYLQGDGVTDLVFGDGVRCAGGSLLRLRTRTNVAGASAFPDSTDTVTLSQRGGVTPGSGETRYYQTYYRNAAALFCPPETFNVTNGMQITW